MRQLTEHQSDDEVHGDPRWPSQNQLGSIVQGSLRKELEVKAINESGPPLDDQAPSSTPEHFEAYDEALGESERLSHKQTRSVMRSFLESEPDFKFTDDFGECSEKGSHCKIDSARDPFKLLETISKNHRCFIDRWIVDPEKAPTFGFRETFVSKTITDVDNAQDKTLAEIRAMQHLRHPHIAVFLGTWERLGKLSLLIYPAACCDLGEFMSQISKDLEHLRELSSPYQDPNDRWSRNSGSVKIGKNVDKSVNNVLELPCLNKLRLLQGYFMCLSRALEYIHQKDVRHKDLKPKNILVDGSGSVVVTDFGIAKRFDPNTSHVTNDDPVFTPKYVSPEMKDNAERDDPSDVFSLGCVFLEMATLLLGKTFANLNSSYASSPTDPGMSSNDSYHKHLPKLYQWIDNLAEPLMANHLDRENAVSTGGELSFRGFISYGAPWSQNLTGTLPRIKSMIATEPTDRPKTPELWSYFGHISLERCRDCHPRHDDIWKASPAQEKAAQDNINHRHSLGLTPNKAVSARNIGQIPNRTLYQYPSHHLNSVNIRDFSYRGGSSSTSSRKVIKLENPVHHLSRPSTPAQTSSDDFEPLAVHSSDIQEQLSHNNGSSSRHSLQGVKAPTTGSVNTAVDNIHNAQNDLSPEPSNRKEKVWIYDYVERNTYTAPHHTLKGPYTKHFVPRFDKHVNILDERGSEIAHIKLDVGLLIRGQRSILGQYPYIYIIHPTLA